jgi:hypothetical protein
MERPWDGHERRRGPSPEELREHLRELRVAWETNLHRDNDEERRARVEAMLETLRATENVTRKVVFRPKTRSGCRRVGTNR